ncbi:porin [Gelidibacter maritimus]|uniref:Porin n=1 Tax=Gelidibacter maritimus TaxID=2761487 RepID=A0A7W2M3V9_9FLAO|nr:porin [Gelidibacter maritimus]MBA6152205.1 porin [Gelidibacter maritimus]
MTFRPTLLALFFVIFSMGHAQEIKAPAFGDGILNLKAKDSTWSMKVGMQLQFQGFADWEDENTGFSNAETNFLIRRARLKFSGFVYSPKLTYKLSIGLSNRDISGASKYTSNAPRYLLDAVMKWNFYKNFELWFGQTKLPGNRDDLTSSSSLQLVERSLVNGAYAVERDLGFQLRHHFKLSEDFIIKEAFAISQGEGRNITSGNIGGFQYTSRLEFLPLGDFIKKGDYVGGDIYREPTPKLAIGATYDFNNKAVKTKSNRGTYMITDTGFYETNISTLFIDAIFKYQGFSLMAEYADRTAADPLAKHSDGTLTGDSVQIGNGVNFQAGYVFENNWELTGRYTNINFDNAMIVKNLQNQYTLGVSKYILGHNLKVQTDVSYLTMNLSNDELLWRLQFAIHF